MFGRNPKRSPVKGDGQQLDVQEIFPTFQGEGPYAGRASIFIRLGGCNLACAFCDTEFESFDTMPVQAILARAIALSTHIAKPLAVITGGEPLRQPIELLCSMLLEHGFDVQVETNGTLFRPLDKRVTVVCSPKAPTGHYMPLREDVLRQCSALKFIISADMQPYHSVPDIGQGRLEKRIPIYVQPMDAYNKDKNAANLAHCIALAQQGGYIFSMQLHKIIGVA